MGAEEREELPEDVFCVIVVALPEEERVVRLPEVEGEELEDE